MPQPNRATLYIITTCPRCRRVKEFMDQLGIDYDLVPVDLIPREERLAIIEKFRQFHPIVSFPVIETGEVVLIGTNPDEVRQVFGAE